MQRGELQVLRAHVEGELHRGANSADVLAMVAGVFATVREERVATVRADELELRQTPGATRKRNRHVEYEINDDSDEE